MMWVIPVWSACGQSPDHTSCLWRSCQDSGRGPPWAAPKIPQTSSGWSCTCSPSSSPEQNPKQKDKYKRMNQILGAQTRIISKLKWLGSVKTLNKTIAHRETSLCQQGVKLLFVEAVNKQKTPGLICDFKIKNPWALIIQLSWEIKNQIWLLHKDLLVSRLNWDLFHYLMWKKKQFFTLSGSCEPRWKFPVLAPQRLLMRTQSRVPWFYESYWEKHWGLSHSLWNKCPNIKISPVPKQIQDHDSEISSKTILRQLRGSALSDLFSSLFQAFFRQTGETCITFRGDVGVKYAR